MSENSETEVESDVTPPPQSAPTQSLEGGVQPHGQGTVVAQAAQVLTLGQGQSSKTAPQQEKCGSRQTAGWTSHHPNPTTS